MPTRVGPLLKAGGGAGGGGGGSGGGSKSGGTKTTSVKAPRASKFFKASNFTAATATTFTVMTQNKGYLHAIIFSTCVGLGLIILGAVLVHIGDDKFIVDLMVLGGLFLVMGAGSMVLGCVFTLRPVCEERKKHQKNNAGRSVRSAVLPDDNTPDVYSNPAFLMVEMSHQRGHDSSASDSVSNNLYDRQSLGAKESTGGRLVPPSPPPVTQPSSEGRGTASTILTTVGAESDEVSEFSNEVGVFR